MNKEMLNTIKEMISEVYFLGTVYEDVEHLKVLFTHLELLLEKEKEHHDARCE